MPKLLGKMKQHSEHQMLEKELDSTLGEREKLLL